MLDEGELSWRDIEKDRRRRRRKMNALKGAKQKAPLLWRGGGKALALLRVPEKGNEDLLEVRPAFLWGAYKSPELDRVLDCNWRSRKAWIRHEWLSGKNNRERRQSEKGRKNSRGWRDLIEE